MKRNRDRDRDRERDKGESSSMGAEKGKMWQDHPDDGICGGGGGGMDELLEVLGYKVKSSDMADVAQKLEQLEMVMGTAPDDGISHLLCDTVVEQEASHNGAIFTDRFNEALHYCSTMFDSLESSGLTQPNNSQDVVMSEVYLGRQICNVVACEGTRLIQELG